MGFQEISKGRSAIFRTVCEAESGIFFQMEFAARQQYPGFTRNIYLKAERFNLHLRPRSVLIEAGTQLNTVEEERNAMEILANLLDEVLQQH